MATEEMPNWSVRSLTYTMHTIEVQRAVKDVDGVTRPCVLVDAQIVGDDNHLDLDGVIPYVPCFPCSGCINSDSYFEITRQKFFHHLISSYPSLPRSFANSIAIDFDMFVRESNAAHRCPHRHIGVGPTTIAHAVVIDIEEQPTLLDMALRDSLEEAEPMTKPATAESVEDLVKARSMKMIQEGDLFESGWSPVDCTICMDTINTRSQALPMPCFHEYHDDCLRQWLKTSNVCPRCRYNMPC